ncbi:MAG: Gfo/Idh/MocA family oxidoreductase [Bythopirellula sp.]|nr:Gfo/Idh/MocA family oxidoreductase [Bythopirellula sp.]
MSRGAAVTLAGITTAASTFAAEEVTSPRRIRVGIIGCGSVSHSYLPHLEKCPHAELVSACDIIPERAANQAKQHKIPHQYPNIEQMLAGADFDLLVNLTDMQEHEHLNRQAIAAGKHVWSEKPIANSLGAGQEILEQAKAKGVRVWGAPVVVSSPQFTFMSEQLAKGTLGKVACAHAHYGHTGPTWSSFFYEKGGGSMPDLGVYNLTSLTGLFGPARSVVAMVNVITPTRKIDIKGEIQVAEEDNAMILLEHDHGVLSHIQCGFNYFNPHGHGGGKETRHTIAILGTHGYMGLVGYDWEPLGVDVATDKTPESTRHVTDPQSYVWPQGASLVAECLATGKEPLFTPEHALHVVEIMSAARESQATGRRIDLKSKFRWPLIV